MRGRKAKPTRLKIIQGNPGKRALNKDEPRPEQEIPEKPDFLGPDAALEWDRISRELDKLGLITKIDRTALAAYCVAYGRWADAERMINEKGTLHAAPNGTIQTSPFLWVANKAMEQMHKFLTEFGMTPSSRTRVSAAPKSVEDDNPYRNRLRKPSKPN